MEKSLESIIKLCENLKKLSPYIKHKEIGKVVIWAQEDIEEMRKIRNTLIQKNLFQIADSLKVNKNFNFKKSNNVEKNILEVYKIIAEELEEWRDIYLKILLIKEES